MVALPVITHKRAQAGSCQCHGEGCDSDWVEIKDAWVDVQWRECLFRERIKNDLNQNNICDLKIVKILKQITAEDFEPSICVLQ